MRRIILFMMLLSVLIEYCNAQDGPTYFGKSLFHDNVTPNNVLYVSNTASGTNEYKTISDALNNYSTGDLIILAPEYFDEDVTISIDNVHIQGLNTELSKIKSLTVTGGYARLENFTVNGTATFTSQKAFVGDWHTTKTELSNIEFNGALNFGTSTVQLKECIEMKNCSLLGNNDFTINMTGYIRTHSFAMYEIQSDIANRGNIIIYGGEIRFVNNRAMYVDSLIYKNPANLSAVMFHNSFGLSLAHIKTVTSTAFHVLYLDHITADLGLSSGGSDFVFGGKFELDIIQSSIALWNSIVFNSTANSRFLNFQQRGFQSTATISGTGLAYLRIYDSVFKQSSAPVGLGADVGNIWNAFIDN